MEPILIIAALIVSFLVFTFLLRVAKSAISTAITIAIVILLLQLVFGIGPGELWEQMVGLWQGVWQNFR
jgi:lysylphosphatidylglycerol synthetase-like protein (DUF2156 family)